MSSTLSDKLDRIFRLQDLDNMLTEAQDPERKREEEEMGFRMGTSEKLTASRSRLGSQSALSRDADGCPRCPLVPFGMIVDHLLAADGERLVLLSCAGARRQGTGIAFDQTASLEWAHADAGVPVAGDGASLAPMAAALHAALLSGAMVRVLEMCLQYCNERSQFGKTCG